MADDRAVVAVRLPEGRVLRAVLAGSGGPTVVFEAGLGGSAASWTAVQRELARTTRTVAYDRAGIGGSTVDPAPRHLHRLVDDLDALLTGLGENAPVVLVGHSWGGPVVRGFADAHPHRVAGVVLVDATISAVVSRAQARQNRVLLSLLAAVSPLGLHRPFLRAAVNGAGTILTDEDRALLLEDVLAATTVRASSREAAQIAASLGWLRELEDQGLPDVPVTTVVGCLTGKGSGQTTDGY